MTDIADNANNQTKLCALCNLHKPVSHFYRSILNKDGLLGKCKECHCLSQKKNKSYKEVAHHKKFWLYENKLKTKAHRDVSYAIKKGTLVRQPCEKCGTTANVVAHHEDYTKPLDVVWLCKQHHKERHLEIDRENKDKPKPDMVNHPAHYTAGGIETIEYIRAKLSPEEYVGYLRGNIMKYTSRIGLKDDSVQEAAKIEWYSKELHRFLREG